MPLATPEVDPKKNIRRQKTLQEGTSTTEPGDSSNLHYSSLTTPVVVSHFPITPSVAASRSLNFGSFLLVSPLPVSVWKNLIFLFPHELYCGLNPEPLNIFPLRA